MWTIIDRWLLFIVKIQVVDQQSSAHDYEKSYLAATITAVKWSSQAIRSFQVT